MGEFVNRPLLQCAAWSIAIVIAGLNAWLLAETVRSWLN